MLSGNVSLVSIPANLLVAPAVAPATVLGVLMALVAPVCTTGRPAARLGRRTSLRPGSSPSRQVSARVPAATVPWPDGITGGLLLLPPSRSRGWRRQPCAGHKRCWPSPCRPWLVLLVSPFGPRTPWPPADLRAVVCDVGQGDAIVVPTAPAPRPARRRRPRPGGRRSLPRRTSASRRSTPSSSRTSTPTTSKGLPGAIDGRSVGEVVVGPIDDPPEEAERVRGWAADASAPLRRVVGGGAASGRRGVAGRCSGRPGDPRRGLGPEQREHRAGRRHRRRTAAAHRRRRGRGAGSPAAERWPRLDPPVDVLKVPHHGSRSQDPEPRRARYASAGGRVGRAWATPTGTRPRRPSPPSPRRESPCCAPTSRATSPSCGAGPTFAWCRVAERASGPYVRRG